MDFCSDFANIQSVFHHCNDNLIKLQKITERGGNETYIADIVKRLTRILKTKNYIDDDDNKPKLQYNDECRKITLYMILNTSDVQEKFNFKENTKISHLVNTMPQLTKCILMACIWSLKLYTFFCEFIAYTPPMLSIEYLENIADSLKYYDPYETLEYVDNLVTSIYRNICRTDYYTVESKKEICEHFLTCIMKLLRSFFTVDEEKYSSWNKKKYYKYLGYVLLHNLSMIKTCFNLYQVKPLYKDDNDIEISNLFTDKQEAHDYDSKLYSDNINNGLLQINNALMNSLQSNVMLITIDIFLYWVEIDINDKTLQSLVGEEVYYVMNLININDTFKHDVINQLTNISIKPKSIEELAKEMTLGELMLKIDNTNDENDKSVCLYEFIKRGEIVLGNSECLETIIENFLALKMNHAKLILTFWDHVDDDFKNNIRKVLLDIIVFSSKEEIIDLIIYEIKLYELSCNVLELDNFDDTLTTLLNQTINNNGNITIDNYLLLIAQNPKKFYNRLFNECIKNNKQIEIIIIILKGTKQISTFYLDDNINTILNNINNNSANETNNIITLFYYLYNEIYIIKDYFIKSILYNNIKKSLELNEYDKLLMLLKIFYKIIIKKNLLNELLPPILVMFGEILENCRWDIIKYTNTLNEICSLVIVLINNLIKNNINILTEKDKKWIINKIKNYKLINKYYYQKLYTNNINDIQYFDNYLKPNLGQLNHAGKCLFLCEVFVRCTTKETTWLAKSNDLLPLFSDAMLIITTIAEKSKDNNNTILCLINCFHNYLQIFIDYLLISNDISNEIKNYNIKKLIKIIDKIKNLINNENLILVKPLLNNLVIKIKDIGFAQESDIILNFVTSIE